MAKGPYVPHKISQASIRYLKAQEQNGKHIGFKNLADIIYTDELKRHPHERAAEIAIKTAGMQAVAKGIHKGTHRNHIPVVR